MGFWKMMKFWDPQALAESVVEAQIKCFAKFWSEYRERDPNAWLALTLQSRATFGGQPEGWYYAETAPFSLAPTTAQKPQAPIALGLYILSKERPDLILPYMSDDFEYIMSPVFEMAKRGEIEGRWCEVNPWTANYFPEVGPRIRSLERASYRVVAKREEG